MSDIRLCGPLHAAELPDAGEGTCCYGAAFRGSQGCTCWEPVFDHAQQELRPAEPVVRARACADCAYRPDSPERSGVAGYAGDADTLDALPVRGERFWCHQGMRRMLRLRHPSGAEVEAGAAAYEPPIADGVPYRADGTPAEVCAGWAARVIGADADCSETAVPA